MTGETKEKSSGQEMSEARLALHGRILRCSLGGNPPDCPLYKIRQRSIEKRFVWLDSRSEEQCEALLCKHIKCLKRKTSLKSLA